MEKIKRKEKVEKRGVERKEKREKRKLKET